MAKLFGFQLVAIAVAAAIFRVGLDPRIAGLIAGSCFVGVGIAGVIWAWRTWVVWVLSLTHLFAIALPMIGFRLLNWNEPFSRVEVWGLSGPEFHTISTRVYAVWMVSVLVFWLLAWRKSKKHPN